MDDSQKLILKEKIKKDIQKLDLKIEELKDFTQPIEPEGLLPSVAVSGLLLSVAFQVCSFQSRFRFRVALI